MLWHRLEIQGCRDAETWRSRDAEAKRHRDKETLRQRHRDAETDAETPRQRDTETETLRQRHRTTSTMTTLGSLAATLHETHLPPTASTNSLLRWCLPLWPRLAGKSQDCSSSPKCRDYRSEQLCLACSLPHSQILSGRRHFFSPGIPLLTCLGWPTWINVCTLHPLQLQA